MNYVHDVFISYSRRFPYDKWVRDEFLPLFEGDLTQELALPNSTRPRIYIDEQIPIGANFVHALKHALAVSKCVLAVWCPTYFDSPYCLGECYVMRYRQKKCEFDIGDSPLGLVLPVLVNDGEHFLNEDWGIFRKCAESFQYMDFKEYAYIGEGFRSSPIHLNFQKAVRKLARQVAVSVKAAPEWGQEFYRWTDDARDEFDRLYAEYRARGENDRPPMTDTFLS